MVGLAVLILVAGDGLLIALYWNWFATRLGALEMTFPVGVAAAMLLLFFRHPNGPLVMEPHETRSDILARAFERAAVIVLLCIVGAGLANVFPTK